MSQRNYAIDAFRIVGAFCVVALHSPLGDLPNALALLLRLGSRWAVPFFFLVSGYFVARKLREKELNASGTINNLLAIFLVANFSYCLFYLLDNNPATTVKLTFVGLLVGQSRHLWFMGSSIFGLLILQYLVSRYSAKVMLVVAIVVLIFILAGDGYAAVSSFAVQYEVARYLTSIPFLLAGFLLARQERLLGAVSAKAWAAIAVAGLLLEVGEAVALYKLFGTSPHNQELLLGTCVAALGLFCLSVKLVDIKDNVFSRTGKTYSLLIYLYHPIIIALLFESIAIGRYSNYWYWISPLVVFSALLLLLKLMRKFSSSAFAVISGS